MRYGGDVHVVMLQAVVPSVPGPCKHDRYYTIVCFFVKLGRHVNHDERMNPIDFWRSEVKGGLLEVIGQGHNIHMLK